MKKIIISLAIIGVVAGITLGITGAWWTDQAKSSNASFHSGTMDLQLYGCNQWGNNCNEWRDDVYQTWDYDNMVPGGEPEGDHLWLRNNGSTPADWLKFDSITDPKPATMNEVMRITKLAYAGETLLEDGAGADLSNYQAPAYCNVTVDPGVTAFDTIHEGIAAAGIGDIVCVKPGNYTSQWENGHADNHADNNDYPAVINNSITLVSLEGPENTKLSPASKNAIDINSSNVTIKGFTITGAVYGIDIEEASNVVVQDNIIKDYSKNGIWMNGGSATITNNKIEASVTPNTNYSEDSIYVSGQATVTVSHNNLKNNRYSGNIQTGLSNPGAWSTAAGLSVHEDTNVTATYNVIDNNDFGLHAKGKEWSHGNPILVANFNDITNNGSGFFYEFLDQAPSTPFDATHNWWGDFDPSDQVSDNVNYTSYLGGAYNGFVNGNDQNNNGFADLEDLHVEGTIAVENPQLDVNGGNEQPFELEVQLDGPTSNNGHRGGSVGLTVTVTMGQGPAN